MASPDPGDAPSPAVARTWPHGPCTCQVHDPDQGPSGCHAAVRVSGHGVAASSREALASVNPVPYYRHYGENAWAGVKAHLDAVTERAAAPVIAKYTGVLAAADIEVFTMTTTFAIMQSLRLDKGPSGPVHPLSPDERRAPGPAAGRSRCGAAIMLRLSYGDR